MLDEKFLYERLNCGSSSFFKVAKYQRNYEWTNTQINELWNDLVRISENEQTRSHFLNNIITYNNRKEKIIEIVDGQQRIVTFLIMCIAIKNFCNKNNPELYKDYVWEIQSLLYSNSKNRHRVQLHAKDMEAYEWIFTNGNSSNPNLRIRQNKIYKAYLALYSKLRKYNGDIISLINGLQRLSISENSTDDEQEAAIAFARVNATGCKMEDHERFNAYVHQKILREITDETQQYHCIQKWISIYNTEKMSIDFLIYTYGYSLDTSVGYQKEGYADEMARIIKAKDIKAQDIINGIQELHDFWVEPSTNRRIIKFLDTIKLLSFPMNTREKGSSFVMPKIVIDTLYREYEWGKFDNDIALQTLRVAEDMLFKRIISSKAIRTITIFDTPLKNTLKVCNGKDKRFPDIFLKECLDSLRDNLVANYDHFKMSFKTKNFKTNSLKFYVLYKANEYMSNYDDVTPKDLTIEHIMPRSSKNDNIDKIGNLTLLPLSVNSSLKDCDFIKKRESYLNTQLKINEWFRDRYDFTEESISERTDYIFNIIVKVFPRFDNETNTYNDEYPRLFSSKNDTDMHQNC